MATAVEHSEIQGTAETVAEITVNCQTEFKQYAHKKPEDIWALVTLRAPYHEDDKKRAPIDIVAVIDKSGSMAGMKLELVKQTLAFVINQLKDGDRLSVVTYDTNVYVDFGLTKMSKSNKATCSAKVKGIRDGSSTNLSGGLIKGLCQIIDRDANKNEVASVLLFTDGVTNAGITSQAGIVAAMGDPKRFDGACSTAQKQVPKHQSWLKKLSGKGKPIEHTDLPPGEQTGGSAPASVYTFGFGSDHDPVMLKAISDAGNGMYYYIENEDKIPESFGHCLGGLLSTVGQGIQLDLTTAEGVKIKEVHVNRPHNIASGHKSVNVNMGDLQSEEERDVVINLSIDALSEPQEVPPQPLFTVVSHYFNVVTHSLSTSVGYLGVMRTSVADNRAEESSVDVNKQRNRIETSSAIAEAMHFADGDNLEQAKDVLNNMLVANRANVYAQDEYMNCLAEDLEACSSFVQSRSVYREKGQKLCTNMRQMHEQQKSSETQSPVYKLNSKDEMAARFKSESTKNNKL